MAFIKRFLFLIGPRVLQNFLKTGSFDFEPLPDYSDDDASMHSNSKSSVISADDSDTISIITPSKKGCHKSKDNEIELPTMDKASNETNSKKSNLNQHTNGHHNEVSQESSTNDSSSSKISNSSVQVNSAIEKKSQSEDLNNGYKSSESDDVECKDKTTLAKEHGHVSMNESSGQSKAPNKTPSAVESDNSSSSILSLGSDGEDTDLLSDVSISDLSKRSKAKSKKKTIISSDGDIVNSENSNSGDKDYHKKPDGKNSSNITNNFYPSTSGEFHQNDSFYPESSGQDSNSSPSPSTEIECPNFPECSVNLIQLPLNLNDSCKSVREVEYEVQKLEYKTFKNMNLRWHNSKYAKTLERSPNKLKFRVRRPCRISDDSSQNDSSQSDSSQSDSSDENFEPVLHTPKRNMDIPKGRPIRLPSDSSDDDCQEIPETSAKKTRSGLNKDKKRNNTPGRSRKRLRSSSDSPELTSASDSEIAIETSEDEKPKPKKKRKKRLVRVFSHQF